MAFPWNTPEVQLAHQRVHLLPLREQNLIMNIRTPRHGVTALALVIASASTVALAGPTNAPFKATLVAQEVINPVAPPSTCVSYFAGKTTGVGYASALGAVTGMGTDCINPTGTGEFQFSDGKLILTTAAGDELLADYSGKLVPTGTGQIYKIISGTYRITGGTGRFSGVSGNGTLSGFENLGTLQSQLEFAGTITY